MHSKLKGLVWIGLAVGFAFALVEGIPLAARHFPRSLERRIGEHWNMFGENQLCSLSFRSPKYEALSKLVTRIVPVHPPLFADDADMPISVEIVEGSTINAFATLGGKIYVFDGLLQQAESPEELAGILAHEIEHVKKRHVLQGVFLQVLTAGIVAIFHPAGGVDTRTLSMLMHMQFGRQQEADADRGGLERLKAAHVDPAGFQHFFERMANQSTMPEILSDHPSNESRAETVKSIHADKFEPILNAGEWKSLRSACRKEG